MKILYTFLVFMFYSLNLYAQTNSKHVKVEGYYKSNGTYVQLYYRTAPNSTNRDNFSTKGNVNPYTNVPGYIKSDNNILLPSNIDVNTTNLSNSIPIEFSSITYSYSERPLYITIKKTKVREYMDYSSAVAMELDVNEEVRVINSFFGDSGWWEVYHNGKSGYVNPNYLKKSDNDRLLLSPDLNSLIVGNYLNSYNSLYSDSPSYIVIKRANIREHMSTASAIITTLNEGDEVKVIDSFFGNIGWWEIYYKGIRGYMYTSLLKRKKE